MMKLVKAVVAASVIKLDTFEMITSVSVLVYSQNSCDFTLILV